MSGHKAKIIIAPDSFKGTMPAVRVCEIMSEAVLKIYPNAEIIKIPIADGGEGTVEAFGAERVNVRAANPNFKQINSFYGILKGNTAVIEMAACAGLPLAEVKNPEITTTYGVGELILHALDSGIRSFIIGLGGSATNDAGAGMAAALGVKFIGTDGKSFIPTGGTLENIADVDMSQRDKRLAECKFTAMCDITNPLYGENGAAYVFAPQKGADFKSVMRLDNGLRRIAEFMPEDAAVLAGGGAAGGMGAGVYAFLNAELKSGIKTVLEAHDFAEQCKDASLILTGEGRFDSQSLGGKAVSGLAEYAAANSVPLAVIAGSADDSVNEEANRAGVCAVFSIQRTPLPFEQAVLRSEADLYHTVLNALNLIKSVTIKG